MSDKYIESFLKYEEKRKDQKSPNEFQNVKNLQEKTIRKIASGGANTAQVAAGAGTGYTGGPRANTPVSTTTLSDFPSIENAMKRFGEVGRNPVGAIASGIGAATRSITDRLSSSDEPRRQFPTPEAMRPTPAPGEGSMDAAAASTQRTPPTEDTSRTGIRPTPTSSTGRTSAATSHTVVSGDNLSTLAQKNNLSVRDIMAANPDITDPNKIRLGQTIRIPRSLAASDKKIYAGGVGATNESVEFSEAELAHFKSILEAMPVAPTAEGHGPNPTPKNKAEGGKGRGSLSEKTDPVGKEDEDVDNDGKVDSSDKYLKNRRAAIAANMKKK